MLVYIKNNALHFKRSNCEKNNLIHHIIIGNM
jgi:hypothetical protein